MVLNILDRSSRRLSAPRGWHLWWKLFYTIVHTHAAFTAEGDFLLSKYGAKFSNLPISWMEAGLEEVSGNLEEYLNLK